MSGLASRNLLWSEGFTRVPVCGLKYHIKVSYSGCSCVPRRSRKLLKKSSRYPKYCSICLKKIIKNLSGCSNYFVDFSGYSFGPLTLNLRDKKKYRRVLPALAWWGNSLGRNTIQRHWGSCRLTNHRLIRLRVNYFPYP